MRLAGRFIPVVSWRPGPVPAQSFAGQYREDMLRIEFRDMRLALEGQCDAPCSIRDDEFRGALLRPKQRAVANPSQGGRGGLLLLHDSDDLGATRRVVAGIDSED